MAEFRGDYYEREHQDVAVFEVPDWVLEQDHPDGADPRDMYIAEAEGRLSERPRSDVNARMRASRQRRDWLEEHAPHLTFADLQAERRRRTDIDA